jgi:hypothetical protein
MPNGKNSKPVTLDDLRDEIRMSNRLMVAQLALNGVQQKDIAAVIGRADSVVSEMFATGLLRRLSKLNKLAKD